MTINCFCLAFSTCRYVIDGFVLINNIALHIKLKCKRSHIYSAEKGEAHTCTRRDINDKNTIILHFMTTSMNSFYSSVLNPAGFYMLKVINPYNILSLAYVIDVQVKNPCFESYNSFIGMKNR